MDSTRDDLSCCPLCGCATGSLASHRGRRLRHCAVCDLVSVFSSDHPGPERERARYGLHVNDFENVGYVSRLRSVINLAAAFMPDMRRILDYGCGPQSVLVRLLQTDGFEAIGYDPHFAPTTELSRAFDAVLSTETFEHFASPAMEVARIVKLIRPGGLLAVMTLWHPGAANLAGWWYLNDETHVSFYSRATMEWIAGRFKLRRLYCDSKNLAIYQAAFDGAGPDSDHADGTR